MRNIMITKPKNFLSSLQDETKVHIFCIYCYFFNFSKIVLRLILLRSSLDGSYIDYFNKNQIKDKNTPFSLKTPAHKF